MKLRLGAAVVLSVVIIMVFLTFLGSREKFASSSYRIKIQMVDAPNVVENTPIYQSGILIGRVSKVELTDTKGVIITARIYNKHKLYHDQECRLASTLLGDASLRMVARPKDEEGKFPHTEIAPGEVILGQTMLDPTVLVAQMQEKLTVAIDNVTVASEKLTSVADTTNDMLSENRENVRSIMNNAQRITGHSATIVESFSQILDADFCTNLQLSVANLREASERLPGTLEKVDATLENMQSTIQLSNTTITRMTDRMERSMGTIDDTVVIFRSTLENIEKITKPFAEEGVTKMWISNVTNILRNMDTFIETLNRPDSTLGLLLSDRQMYERLNSTIENISNLPRRLDPILFNVQVMTDKLAQHPELLGLRGYLKKDNSGTSMEIPWPKGISPYSSSSQYSSPSYGTYYGNGYGNQYQSASGTYYESPYRVFPGRTSAVAQTSAPAAPQTVRAQQYQPQTQYQTQNQYQPQTQYQPQNPPQLHSAVVTDPVPLKSASTSAPVASSVRSVNAPISSNASEVTPEMLGMTPEEFQKADIHVLSDAVMGASAPIPTALPPRVDP